MGKIKDYLAGRLVRIEPSEGNYWTEYTPLGLFTDYGLYIGKYKIHRTFGQIEGLVPHLIELLKERKIDCFKHKSRETPNIPKHQGELPVLFIYLTKKQREKIETDLDGLGLEDRVWIDDTRRRLQFEFEAHRGELNLRRLAQ
ncbi:MAG: hypothetical protein AABX54_02000 [Nanoarchaeota archaeon]